LKLEGFKSRRRPRNIPDSLTRNPEDIAEVGLLDRLAPRRPESDASSDAAGDLVFGTKALRKFLACLTARESPVLLDLGPVVGSNVSFFGEQLGCKIFVEDIYADLDRRVRENRLEELPEYLERRFSHPADSVDGILCWDVLDFVDRASAQVLARQLVRILRPDGALLAFFATAHPGGSQYTKYIVIDEGNLRHRPYPASRGRQAPRLNRDIIRMFEGLRVSDSFLLQNNLREILFRKPGS
jgi:SAM-dependent methyltransferase